MRLPLWGRRGREEELTEEIRGHLQMAARDRIERGDRSSRPRLGRAESSATWAWSKKSRARCGAGLR